MIVSLDNMAEECPPLDLETMPESFQKLEDYSSAWPSNERFPLQQLQEEFDEEGPGFVSTAQSKPSPQVVIQAMGLKEREKLVDDLRKENFGLKMRIYFLQESLEKFSNKESIDIITEVYAQFMASLLRPKLYLKALVMKLRHIKMS